MKAAKSSAVYMMIEQGEENNPESGELMCDVWSRKIARSFDIIAVCFAPLLVSPWKPFALLHPIAVNSGSL